MRGSRGSIGLRGTKLSNLLQFKSNVRPRTGKFRNKSFFDFSNKRPKDLFQQRN